MSFDIYSFNHLPDSFEFRIAQITLSPENQDAYEQDRAKKLENDGDGSFLADIILVGRHPEI